MGTKKKEKSSDMIPILSLNNTNSTKKPKQILEERNYEISCKYHTGLKIPEIMKEYKISRRQAYRILNDQIKAAKEWAKNLPETTAVIIHEKIARRSAENIDRMEGLIRAAEAQGELKIALDGSSKLSKCYHDYYDIIMNGATLLETAIIVKEAKRVIDARRTE